MPCSKDNLHATIEVLAKSIASLNAGDPRTIEAVRNDFVAVQRTAAVAERHAGDLAAVLGFDCSPPGQVEL